METIFEVGDTVIVTRQGIDDEVCHHFKPGTKGKIIDVTPYHELYIEHDRPAPYLVLENRRWWIFPLYPLDQWVSGSCLELVE